NLSWTPVNTLSYIASRATSLSGVFSDLPETTVGASTFTDTSLVANTRYYYRLKAKNVSGTSTLTDVITASTLLTAPSISGSATSSSEINLSWNAIAGNNVKYQVYKATTLNGSYALITTSDGISAATTSATGLNANTIYYFKVKSCKAKLCSGLSDSVAVLTKPATPTNFKVTNSNSASEISFSWTTDKTLSYLLSRATSLTGAYTDLAGTAVGASTFKDTGLVANTAYYYKLRAQNTAGLSAYTGVITTATLLSSSVLTANPASASQINLSWGSVTGAYYQIYQATTLNGAYAVVTTGTGIITNSLSVTTGLNANARYYFKVKSCITSTACSPLSDAVSALTLPSTPAGFKVVGSPTDTQIKFTWTADKSLSYVVSRAASTDGTYTDLAETVVGATVFTDTGLTANTTYYYKIKAKNASGLSVPSSAITVATSLIIPSLTATAINSSQINLSWNVVTNALYQVYQSGTASGTYAILPNANNVIATSAGVIGLQPGTKYYFKIKACIGNVCSLLSDPVMVLTYPTAPTTLTASKGTGAKVNLSWVANGTSTYVISRATSLAGTYTNIVETATGVTSYADTGVVLNTIYYYNIKAHNTSGYSANSSYASVSTY
ncbi:MAG: fibronectin type III domain-containing protein, partial [Candidatus Falkowbacteria bacterium]|nr:fibronectin type III domain-containing protein [Candidatus Falkowbacteria bacterium]